jgi:hypothetical protein
MRSGSGQNYIAELILLTVQARSELLPDSDSGIPMTFRPPKDPLDWGEGWTERLQDVATGIG